MMIMGKIKNVFPVAATLAIFAVFCLFTLQHIPLAHGATTPSFQIAVTPSLAQIGDDIVAQVVPINFEASTTNFTWFVNNAEIPEASGIAKDTYHFVASDTTLKIIKVTVNPGHDFETISQSAPFRAQDYSRLQNLGGGGGTSGNAGTGGEITSGNFGAPNAFTLSSSDDNPGPDENIAITLQSYSFDKSIARIRWSVNGVTAQTGIGITTYSFTTGKIGSKYTIRATALLDDGTAAGQTIVLNVSDIHFYWWTNTYTPPWYKGKALPVVGSPVYVYAIPEAANINPKTAIYQWSMNDSVLPASSGQGKSVFQFTPQFAGVSERITASIKNAAGESIGEKTISITPTVPQVNVYALKPLEGVRFNQTGNLFNSKPEELADFIAEPFYFGVKTTQDLLFNWTFNNRTAVSAPQEPNVFGIQAPKGFISDQSIRVGVFNPKNKNESATQSFTVNYLRTQQTQ